MNTYAIETNNLTKRFGALTAVDSLSLQVPRGSVFGFLGPNGSGKTTTVRLLLGLLEPDAGSGRVLGNDIATHDAVIRTVSGALLEHNGLYERLSAEKNLDYYANIYHLPPAQKQTRIRELLESVDLWERRKEEVGKWSRGMKQKLAIIRALIHRPKVLFLDEPTAGLDPLASIALRDELKALVEREGVTVFLNTHNLAEAEKLCDLVGVIHKGRLLQVGTPAELGQIGGSASVMIAGEGFTPALVQAVARLPEIIQVQAKNGSLQLTLSSPQTRIHQAITLMVEHGAQIEEVVREKSSLEKVFVQLVENGESHAA